MSIASDGSSAPPFNRCRVNVQGEETVWSSVATLCNAAIGAGVLSIPWAMRSLGWAGGVIVCMSVAAVEGLTLFVLSKLAEKHNAATYQILVNKTLGGVACGVSSLILWVYLFGSCIAYLIVVGDTFQPLASQLFGDSVLSMREVVITVVSVVTILPLCMSRTLGALAGFSSLVVFGIAYLAVALLVEAVSGVREGRPSPSLHPFPTDPSALAATPILVFAFQAHTNVVSIFDELESFPLCHSGRSGIGAQERAVRRRMTEKLRGMRAVILVGFVIVCCGYASVGVLGYVAAPGMTATNILNNFPSDDVLMQVARFAVGVIVIVSYPLNHFPARQSCEQLLSMCGLHVTHSSAWRMAEGMIFFFITLPIALVVDDLGIVFKIVGGTAGNMLIFMLPALMLLVGRRSQVGGLERLLAFGSYQEVASLAEEDMGVPEEDELRSSLGWSTSGGGPDSSAQHRSVMDVLIGVMLLAVSMFVFVVTFASFR